MAAYYLRPSTLSWVLPIMPRFSQLGRDGTDASLCCLSLLALGANPSLAMLPPLYIIARELGINGRTRTAPHAALLLGTLEHGYFHEGERTPLPVGAAPSMHGVPAAALVLSKDPGCEPAVQVAQVYVPDRDVWLVPSSRVHRGRMRRLVDAARGTGKGSASEGENGKEH